MKVLVTGGAGFIGSNVVDAYIEAGHEVVVIDNLFTGNKDNINPQAKFYHVDIRSEEVPQIFEKEKFDLVNHHAAQMSVPASVENPSFDADVNVLGFLNILESARKTEVQKVIFISSGGAIYGEAEAYPTSETSPLVPLSPYAITKAVSEQYLVFYKHQYDMDFTVLRYANVYGPRQIPHGEAGVVAIFMDRLLESKACTVYHFLDEPQGMTRDYCFVGDIVQANLLALDKGSGEIVNIGTGMGTNTMTLYENIFNAVKELRPDLDEKLRSPRTGSSRPGDLSRSCLNVDKAGSILGFKATCSLGEGLKKTLQWRVTI